MILVKPSFEIKSDIGLHCLQLIEWAGRTCYKSEDRIMDDSAIEFVDKIVKRGHLSVIEHASMTVKFIVDRGVSHELVRHRLCSFSQESTRYCNYEGGVTFVIPPWVHIEPMDYGSWSVLPAFAQLSDRVWYRSIFAAESEYLQLLKEGWSPQQARSVLPNSLKTEIVVTANLREWRYIFDLRCREAAHPQMKEVMVPLRDEVRKRIPVIFDEDWYQEIE